MKTGVVVSTLFLVILTGAFPVRGADAPYSEATEECLGCHESIHPGIVEDWKRSRHANDHPEKGHGRRRTWL